MSTDPPPARSTSSRSRMHCPSGCEGCAPAFAQAAERGPYTGGRLALVSLLCFVIPPLAAVAGAMLAGPRPLGQLLGALVGMAAGLSFNAVRSHRSEGSLR